MDIKILLNPVLVWFVVGFVMFLLELIGPGLVIFFFGVGAWVVTLVCLMAKISLNTQLFIFIVASMLTLVLFRRWLTKVFHGHITGQQDLAVDLDDFVGHKAVVKDDILPGKGGKIEFKGASWEAETDGPETLPSGSTVKIVAKDNLTLKVVKY